VPYAIDFMNPAPDADVNSVGIDNFNWIVNHVAELAVKKAQSKEPPMTELRWAAFLNGAAGSSAAPDRLQKAPSQKAASKKSTRVAAK